MKALLTILLLFIAFSTSAQISTKVQPYKEIPNLQSILEENRALKADTNYIYSVTNELYNALPKPKSDDENLHFPYPIIFIHGLASSADTWSDFANVIIDQGWSGGGNLPFCLNGDLNNYYSDIYTDSDVYNYMPSTLYPADFYIINFNVDEYGVELGTGSNPTLSNQAAIVKQGLALSVAIKRIVDVTGRNKVILFGHSMGGLAAREYLQNPNLWFADGKHHVAKLVTTGTPHGGSDVTGFILTTLFGEINESSDAVRDLRSSYFYSGDYGVYLYGGYENSDVMDDSIWGFHNYDVDCDGYVNDFFDGLNTRVLSNNLEYTCIIGNSFGTDDGVVTVQSANIKGEYPFIESETFVIDAGHLGLTGSIPYNYEGFDEADDYHLAYEIEVNNMYNGFMNEQASDAAYVMDYDDFIFTVEQSGWIEADIINFPVDGGASIYTHPDLDLLVNQPNSGALDFTTTSVYLTPGTYYFEMYGSPTYDSWQYPYNFYLNFEPGVISEPVGIELSTTKKEVFKVYPNPTKDLVNIAIDASINDGFLQVINITGKIVHKEKITGQNNLQFDTSSFPNGTYLFMLVTDKERYSKRIEVLK